MGLNRDENFDEASYVRVNDRLAEFWAKYPSGYLTTFRTESPDGTVFKAVAFRNKEEVELYGLTGVAPATGHSFLPSAIRGEKVEEYTETVAVGRALAMLGFKVEKAIATAEEMTRFKHNKTKTEKVEAPAPSEDEEAAPPKETAKLRTTSRFSVNKLSKSAQS